MELDKAAIAARTKKWFEDTFGTVAEGCRQLNLKEISIRNNNLSGSSLPGAPFLAKYVLNGGDIHWLFFGEGKSENKIKETALGYYSEKENKNKEEIKKGFDKLMREFTKLKITIEKL